jgi:hypothetical protein
LSVANILLQPDAGYLFSDAGGWDADGRLVRVDTKLHLLPRAKAAVVVRGMQPPASVIALALEGIDTLDHLLNWLPDMARRLKRMRFPTDSRFSDAVGGLELTVVAWRDEIDEIGIPGGWRLTSDDPNSPAYDGSIMPGEDAAPYKLQPSGVLWISPGPSSLAAFGKPLNGVEDVFALDAEIDGLALMEIQRSEKFDVLRTGRPIHIVGGFCEVAKVTAAGVGRRVLRYWPDVVGQEIIHR